MPCLHLQYGGPQAPFYVPAVRAKLPIGVCGLLGHLHTFRPEKTEAHSALGSRELCARAKGLGGHLAEAGAQRFLTRHLAAAHRRPEATHAANIYMPRSQSRLARAALLLLVLAAATAALVPAEGEPAVLQELRRQLPL